MKAQGEKKTGGMEPIPPELVAQAMAGDQAAFTELYERTSAMLYRTIRSMVRDEDLVWDIQQDSYLRAWSGISELQAPEAFLPWLRRIAVNTATNALNKRAPLNFTDLSDLDDEEGWGAELPDLREDAQPELVLDRKETSRLVREILNKLPQEQQMIVGMYYSEEMPIKDIAETLHVTPGTVKTQLHRGRKRIEAEVRALEQQGVKLYGLSPIPFLLALLRKLEPAPRAEKKVLAAVLAETAAAGSAAAAEGAAAAGTATATVTAMTASQAFLKGLGSKLLAGVLAAALIIGSTLGYDALKKGWAPRIGIEQPSSEENVIPSLSAPDVEDTIKLIHNDQYNAENLAAEQCGDELAWAFDPANGILTFEGSGEMYDYGVEGNQDLYDEYEVGTYPWNTCTDAIKAVAFPDGLTAIGNHAFYGCAELSSITFPDDLNAIGDYAFDGCAELSSVTLPKQLSKIGCRAFGHCTKLTAFSVDPDNSTYSVDAQGLLYDNEKTTLLICPSGKVGKVEIPAGVTTIGDHAFATCSGLTEVSIPESVTTIGAGAFSGCTGLTSIALPLGITAISDGAFNGCTGLTSVTLPAGVAEIGAGAFSSCSELASVVLPESVSDIGESAFSSCKKLTSIPLPDHLVAIGDFAFSCCSSLDSIALPVSLTVLGDCAFLNCTNLSAFQADPKNPFFSTDTYGVLYDKEKSTLLVCPCALSGPFCIPSGVTVIADYAFSNCNQLTEITIPKGVSCIGYHAFSFCSRLTSVVIPEGVTTIEDNAFYDSTGLVSVTIPASISTIGENAFVYCTSLKAFSVHPDNQAYYSSKDGVLFTRDRATLIICPGGKSGDYKIPESVVRIADYALCGCAKLTSVTIPESVTSIGSSAFDSCTGLTSLSIPESVTFIGDWAFSNCTGLTSITIPHGITSIESRLFLGCSGITSVTISESVTSIGNGAFEGCTGLTTVTIPESVTFIGSSVFTGCTGLTSVTIPKSVTYIGSRIFISCSSLTIHGVAGSEAERYAAENEIPFEALS